MDKKVYINRELSWLKFNQRVLEEAASPDNPLFERLRFAAIFASNLDEFYMVRVGSLFDRSLLKGDFRDNKTGMLPKEQLEAVFEATRQIISQRDKLFKRLIRQLRDENIYHITRRSVTSHDVEYLKDYFQSEILPLLSPQIIDNKHPFPHLENRQTYIGLYLKAKDSRLFGLIPVNEHIEGMVMLPSAFGIKFILAEDVIYMFADHIFKMYDVLGKAIFRVTRNADIEIAEGLYDEELDYRLIMKEVLKKRGKLSPVRLEMSGKVAGNFERYLREKLNLSAKQVFVTDSPLNYSYLKRLAETLSPNQKSRLFFKPLVPQRPKCIASEEGIISQALKRDLFFTYPFESFTPVIKLIKEAAVDKKAVSIKITLYRLSSDSKVVEALMEAAENGKEVMAVVELRARFDEANNINWASKLEEAGCKVIYGVEDYKVHAKIMLITLHDGHTVRYITHIGTGNYNEKTARLYTDCNLITSNPEIGVDAVKFFNNLTISNLSDGYKRLLVSPGSLKQGIIKLIDDEIEYQRTRGCGKITAKFNSLTDKDVIDKLVEASAAGVKIDLIIRGICCLQPGIAGLTENISVTSIVGRFLEHSRIYSFYHGGERLIYISSADLMTRNTERRVEIACPILNDDIKAEAEYILEVALSDNVKARVLRPDGNYCYKNTPGGPRVDSQVMLFERAYKHSRTQFRTCFCSRASRAVIKQGNFRIIKGLKNRLWN